MSGCGGFDGGQDERLMTTMPDTGHRVWSRSIRGVIPGKVIIGDWTWGSSHGPNGPIELVILSFSGGVL